MRTKKFYVTKPDVMHFWCDERRPGFVKKALRECKAIEKRWNRKKQRNQGKSDCLSTTSEIGD